MHDLHSTAHAHSATTASTSTGGLRTAGARQATSSLCLLLFTLGVADGLINGKNGGSSLCGSSHNIDSYDLGLPDKELEHVVNFAAQDVNTLPAAFLALHGVDLSELVKHVSSVHTRVVSQLLGDDFKSLGETINNELLLALDVSEVVAEES